MNDLERISNAIDKTLDTDVSWKDYEYRLYKMMQTKVAKYNFKHKAYLLNQDDKRHILANIKEQPWLEKSKHKTVIMNMIKEMDIVQYDYHSDRQETRLRLRVMFKKMSLNIRYHRKETTLKYFVYFENDEFRGDVCYIDTTEDQEEQQKLKLPNYNLINTIVRSSSRRLDKYDVVHLASEFLHYYDENQEISNVKMGIKYPISLKQLTQATQ